jgi:hypothetical protein
MPFHISVFMFIAFFLYEYFEQKKLEDELYKELKQWTISYTVMKMILWITYFFYHGKLV